MARKRARHRSGDRLCAARVTRVLLVGDAPGGPRANPSTPPTVGSIEQVLVTCCANALAAQILVVGHHGSMTSSRTAFLDAIGSSIAVVSSGPTQYGTVTLPDQSIVTELQSRGQVFRTDVDDAGCGQNPNKIGPDADGRGWRVHEYPNHLEGYGPGAGVGVEWIVRRIQ